MKKKFNITGNCYAEKHYMMDNSAKIAKVYELVEEGQYFAINRPRQYGKTTTLFAIEEKLFRSEEYMPIRLNFQGIDSKWYDSDQIFAEMFANKIADYLEYHSKEACELIQNFRKEYEIDLDNLSKLITKLVHFSPKKLVLLIDEVDASSNYMPFLSFLGMLRTKYLARETPQDYTFHSVVLVGVHDVKSLKFKIRNPEEAQFNSPWNIAIDFEANMEFSAKEIAPMLQQYSEAEKVQMDIEAISNKLYEYTSGYPFLVSRLCQIITEKMLPQKEDQTTWELADLEKALQTIQNEVNTNFESLIKNLENHQDLYDLVFAILINGQSFMFNMDNATIRKGVVYGVFKQNGKLKIHNQIYAQRIYNYLISNIEVNQENDFYDSENQFLLPNQSLNFKRVLQRFQAYMKENFATKDQHFWEKQWRLIFLAFLRPILNGKGYDFREVEISDEKRLDVVITYGKFKYIVELKIWRGQDYHERGLAQLGNYLERQNINIGYLVIFDLRRETIWKEDQIDFEGKEIFAVWV